MFPLRSVCFDIDLVPNNVDDGDYRIFTINIEVDSINVITSPWEKGGTTSCTMGKGWDLVTHHG